MGAFRKIFNKAAQGVTDIFMGNGLAQPENIVTSTDGYVTPGIGELCRQCADEGIVLLKNEDEVLPLDKNTKTAVFGRCQIDAFHVGYGSGGNVYPPYQTDLMTSLREEGVPLDEELADLYSAWCADPANRIDHGFWGHWPTHYPELPLSSEQVREASLQAETALIIVGRSAGEDRDCLLRKGSYYLTDIEKDNISLITRYFRKTVLLVNAGNLMDMAYTEQYDFSAVLYVWQLGMEDGRAIADVLTGRVSPSGHLTDTIARHWKDYPSSANFGAKDRNYYREGIFTGYRYFVSGHEDRVLWPFGFGLSYTEFEMRPAGSLKDEDKEPGEWKTEDGEKDPAAYLIAGVNDLNKTESIPLTFRVTNKGKRPGKALLQIYVRLPAGKLLKPDRILVSYAKTGELGPGESEFLTCRIRPEDMASFDEKGNTGSGPAFVLEKGPYEILFGSHAGELSCAGIIEVSETVSIRRCAPILNLSVKERRQSILAHLPGSIPYTGYRHVTFRKVLQGNADADEFLAQLTDRELTDLTRGEGGMGSPYGIAGNAGAFGGITRDLRTWGIPPLITADGPAGVRVLRNTALLPCGTALACTWNLPLIEKLFEKEGEEAAHFGIDVLLSPAMNIHRNPLCGRNFEYYSEDPLVSGLTAAAAVRGIQKNGISACPKHFACNNQEYRRNTNDSRVSERALREIYLRNFEICIREGQPLTIMTSYNKVNGIWSHYHYDLVTALLRDEWGYDGLVITDWFMKKASSPEFPALRDNAYRIRSGVDVLMPGTLNVLRQTYIFDRDLFFSLTQDKGEDTDPARHLTRGELQSSARRVIMLIRRLKNKKDDRKIKSTISEKPEGETDNERTHTF